MFNLKNKTAVITGCNKGIGKSILKKFSEAGINCIACIRKENEEFSNFCKSLEEKNKVVINKIYFDFQNKDEIKDSITKINSLGKEINILVNVAGVVQNSLFHMTSEKNLKDLFEVNFFSQIHFTQGITKLMLRSGNGSVIFISSTAHMRNDRGRFAYASTKAAISSTTKTLARELGLKKIRVNAICPGLTDTDLMKNNTDKSIIDEEIKKISLNRIADPNEIANVALFLASDLSSYITGQNINVDGGSQ